MKTLLIGFLFISLTSMSFSQNEIAYVETKAENVPTLNEYQNNSEYIKFTEAHVSSERVKKFQKLVANYDISEHTIYDPNDPSTYTVEFTEAKNKIIAQYNQEGNIIKCNEKYKNVRLPYAISSQISKSNPGWAFNENVVTFEYSEGEIAKPQYKVYLNNNNRRKIVTIN